MCGRYSIGLSKEQIEAYYGASFEEADFAPTFNVAPGRALPVVLDEDAKLIQKINWGLHPPWFKFARGLINLKAETMANKPFMRRFLAKRCLVPASGFFEWYAGTRGKSPFYIQLKNRDLFSFAGVWNIDKDARGHPMTDFAIITTTPNEVVGKIHNRMPVILEKDEEGEWLNAEGESGEVLKFLKPYPAEDMKVSAVSTKINNPKIDSPDLIRPL